MRRQYLNSILLSFILLFCQCGEKSQDSVTSSKIEEIDFFVQSQVENGFSGNILISKDNSILFGKGYGLSNRELGIPNNLNTRFDVASITKLFTVVAILQLVDNHQLSLDDELEDYFGEFNAPKNQATIEHLILHTAGLVPRGHELDYSAREKFVESVKRTPPESIPGQEYRYTNAGYTMLAAIIEVVSGLSYKDYLTKHIFDPLNLSNTTYWNDETIKNAAIGYEGEKLDSLSAYYTPEWEWGENGSGGIITTVGDLQRFLVGLEKKQLITNESLQKMFNEQMTGEAYGFHILNKPNVGKLLAKGGGIVHFESQIAWYKDHNIKLIITINNHLHLRQPVWDGIEEILFREHYRQQ